MKEELHKAKERVEQANNQINWDQRPAEASLHLHAAQVHALLDIAESLRVLVAQGAMK